MTKQQERAKARDDELKEQESENLVMAPILKMRDLVDDRNDEGGDEQCASSNGNISLRDERHDHPDACAFNQRGDGGYRRFLAEAVQLDIIFNQGEKNGQQKQGNAKRHERKRPQRKNVQ